MKTRSPAVRNDEKASITMMAHECKSRMEPPLRIPSPEDVLAAFPAPPNHIPTSPAVTVPTSSSYFSLPRTKAAPKRKDSAASGWSVGSGQSAQSGKLSVLINGKDVEFERQIEKKRDSGSSSSSGLNASAAGSMLPSPMSGRAYFTAPNSPLPPGTPGAGPSSSLGDARTSPLYLNSPASACSTSATSPASVYPASSAPSSAYPHSPAYSYSNTSRFALPSPYTPSSSSSASALNPNLAANSVSAYAPSSARTALSMLSMPVSASASASSSPSSVHVPVSAVGSNMSPIEESDERERERPRMRTRTQRQSSVPPPNFRLQPPVRRDSGNEIGGPPCAPLPPLPPTAKSNSSFGESTPRPMQTQMPGQDSTGTPRGPASVKSLPSLRSNRSRKDSSSTHEHEHGRKESGVSVLSAASGFSAAAPSLVEFGIAIRSKADTQVESGSEATDNRISGWERPRSRARTPRAGTLPLRIDIPPSFAQEKERVLRQQQQRAENSSLGSANSVTSPFPRELSERSMRERAVADGEKVNSPTASLFSVASGATARSGLSAAQSLRTRVSGMLDGLGHIPNSAVPSANTSPTAAVTKFAGGVGGVGGGGEEFEKQKQQRSRSASLRPPSMSNGVSSGGVVGSGNGFGDVNSLLTAEDLHSDPLLARSISPVTPLENGRDVPKFSPEFPTTPTARSRAPPPSSYTFPSSSSSVPSMQTPTSASSSLRVSSNGVSRTISQSRRKPLPLPPAPRALRASTTSVSSRGSFGAAGDRNSYSQMDGADDAIRGRGRGGRGGRGTMEEDGSTSPDIEMMMCKTPRPVLRSKSLSARSSRSSKSLSTRSSSVRSSVRNSTRPSLPDEYERQKALARVSAASSSSSASPSRASSMKYKELTVRKSAGSEFVDAYGGIEEDGDVSVDYGVAIARHRGGYDLSPSLLHVDELEENVDEFGALRTGTGTDAGDFYAEEAETMLGETDKSSPEQVEEDESDSDIDLHTPLPHILVRDGALSPNSKVLAVASSTGSLSVRSSFVGSGRDSVISSSTHASFGSVMTKTGLFKDERNTEGRRRRHRDGKLLREGLGLTTGLGWSDSEDEDAPSPFTNRLSSLAVSRNASTASARSSTSKKSLQFFTRSTPSSGSASRTLSTHSAGRPNLASSRSSRSPVRKNGEPHPLSKSHSSVGLSRPYAVLSQTRAPGDENRSMSPTLTTSSSTSLPFPPTPRDDCDDSDGGLPSGSAKRLRAASRASSVRAKTPTVGSVKASQSTSQLRARAMSSTKSAPLSRLPSTSGSTPRPLRLPALQLQQQRAGQQEDGLKLEPGQPAPRSGALLGYNRNLHDQQRSQYRDAPSSAPMVNLKQMSPPLGGGAQQQSPVVSPALSAQSAPSSSTAYGASRGAYGSMPVTSALRPPSSYPAAARSREPSPQRLSASTPGIGKPRTGTGMVYRQSSLPPAPPVGRAAAI